MDVTVRNAVATDLDTIRDALIAAGLPVDSVEASLNRFFICESDGVFSGAAGLEIHGTDGLLRSVVVDPVYRRQGIAERLCKQVIDDAGDQGCRAVYLLTLDAAGYFERLGFEQISRTEVPVGIRKSEEFSSLCPDTAVLMRRSLNL